MVVKWTEKETEKLLQEVRKHGSKGKWNKVAEAFTNRWGGTLFCCMATCAPWQAVDLQFIPAHAEPSSHIAAPLLMSGPQNSAETGSFWLCSPARGREHGAMRRRCGYFFCMYRKPLVCLLSCSVNAPESVGMQVLDGGR